MVAFESLEEFAWNPFLLLLNAVKDAVVLVEATAEEVFKPLNIFVELGVKLEFPEKGFTENVLAGKLEVLLFNPANPENPWKTPPS